MDPVFGFILYWVIQLGVFVYVVMKLRRMRDEWDSPATHRDSPLMRIALCALVPVFPFVYFIGPALLAHKPAQTVDIGLAIFTAIVMSLALILRFWRQDRKAAAAVPVPVFRYRAKDGRICGPDSRERLLVLRRMGVVDDDTPIAAYATPEGWHPLSGHPAFVDAAEK